MNKKYLFLFLVLVISEEILGAKVSQAQSQKPPKSLEVSLPTSSVQTEITPFFVREQKIEIELSNYSPVDFSWESRAQQEGAFKNTFPQVSLLLSRQLKNRSAAWPSLWGMVGFSYLQLEREGTIVLQDYRIFQDKQSVSILQAIVGIKWEPTSLSLGLFQPWLAGGLSPTLLVSDKSLLSDSYSKKSLPLFARAGFSIQSKRDTDNLINKLGVSVGYQRIITSYGYSLKGDNIFTSVLLFY